MNVIIDCGGSKCDFLFDNKMRINTQGFNPNIHEIELLKTILTKDIILYEKLVLSNHINFYGAGCSSEENKGKIKKVLMSLFPKSKITVGHDLDLSVFVMSEGKPCFVCILGTGSNSCFFDGKVSHCITPSLGFILGDEGGGVWFGKRVVRDYFYQKLPKEMKEFIEENLTLSLSETINKLYVQPGTNRWLASYTHLLSQFKETEYVQSLLQEGFTSFCECFILAHPNAKDFPIHFTGSVAYYFEKELKESLHKLGLQLGNVRKNPLGEKQ